MWRIEVDQNNSVVCQIEKTKEERHPDLFQEQQKHLTEIQQEQKVEHKWQLQEKQKAIEEARKEREARSYDRLFTEENMTSNKLKA